MSYSQYDEQKHILKAFDGYVPGEKRFLDIGAWNAKMFSNTRALYELGWSGILIEPSPGPMLGLLAEYGEDPRITLIQACVSVDDRKLIEMHITDDAVSTASTEEYEIWKGTAKFLGKMSVPALSMNGIAQMFGGVDFVNIDAEGVSVDLFLKALELGWQPRCFCVEHDGREGAIIAAATPLHYSVVYGNGTNLVLVRR